MSKAHEIARAFCAELPPLNGEQPQDVCDANEVMQAAFIACGEPDPADLACVSPRVVALWNVSWEIAASVGFDASKIE